MSRGVRCAALIAAALALAACGHSRRQSTSGGPPLLAFVDDTSQPLDYADHGVVARRGRIAVHDVAFASGGRSVVGYLVEEQPRHGRRPAVVLVHGSGGDRGQLLGDAVALAGRGIVALTITEPSSAQPARAVQLPAALLAQARAQQVRDVVAVRRAADVLASLPNVDPRRLGYLGWSAGAKTGAFVAASDARFRALVLLSAGADELARFVAAAPQRLRPTVRRLLGSVDPIRYVARARPGTLLLEDGTDDAVVPHEALLNIVRAAPRGTLVRWYAAGHALNESAFRDAFAWLIAKLDHRSP